MKRYWTIAILLAAAACSRPSEDGGERTLIQNKGSDTLVNVAQAWAETYKEINPNVAVAVMGGGSGTGISAMINDTVSLAQLAEIYGEEGSIDTWDQLGVEVPGCESSEIVRVSRQNNSGTYVYIKEAVLGKEQDYKLGSRDMHGSKDVVDLVLNTPCAIGYSGLAYATEEVKIPCVMEVEGGDCIAPSVATAIDHSYPIARPLFMYTAGQPVGARSTWTGFSATKASASSRKEVTHRFAPLRAADVKSKKGVLS